jgi:CheY-like chemotaxis protein
MTYGFAKQSGGHITIYSEPGEGTTVKLYFPRFKSDEGWVLPSEEKVAPQSSDNEVVLVVEDNADVRGYSVMTLKELGYRVLEAKDAEAALTILAQQEQRIDLLFTDIVLPGRNGRALAEEGTKLRPDLKVLYTTGYSRNAILHHGRLDAGVQLISKPFTFDQLGMKVGEMFEMAPSRSA